MKKFRLLILSASLCGAAVFTGCVDTANNELSEVEQGWVEAIRDSYPGYRAPKTMPPAVRGSVVYYEEVKSAEKQEQAAPAASDDPAATVDRAAAGNENELPVAKEDQAAPAESKEAKEQDKQPAAPAGESADVKAEKSEKAVPESTAPAAKAEPAVKGGNAEITVKSGDTIGGIAKEFYGNAKYADVILKANPQVKNPKRLKIGTKLVIPAL